MGCNDDFRPWTSKGRPLELPASQRMADCVDISQAYRMLVLKDTKSEFYVDVSQCSSRSFGRDTLSCITSSSCVFAFHLERALVPGELAILHGLHHEHFSFAEVPTRELTERVGEGMFCGSLGAVLIAMHLNPLAPWW